MGPEKQSDTKKASGAGCLFIFAVPFAIGGVVMLVLTGREIASVNPDWDAAFVWGGCGLVFSLIGCGLIWAFRRVSAIEREARERRECHPDSPWNWREDWADGVLRCETTRSRRGAWVLAVFWNLVSLPLCFALPGELEKGNWLILLGLIFPLVGVGLLARAVLLTLRLRRFGVSRFQMGVVPAPIGGRLGGVIEVSAKLQPEDGFRLRLTCLRKYRRGTGDDRRTVEKVLWQDEQTMSHDLLDRDPLRTAIPVSFRIPEDVAPSDDTDPDDKTIWSLRATASVPGLDYCAVFEVPVFQVDDSAVIAASDVDPAEKYRLQEPAHCPGRSKIRVEPQPDGATEVIFPAARNRGAALGLTLFVAMFAGATWLQAHLGAPMIFPVVFGGFTALLVVCAVELWLGVTRVRLEPDRVLVTTRTLGLGRTRELAADQIREVITRIGMTSGRTVWYDIEILPHAGRRLCAGRHLRDKREAEWLAAEARRAVGKAERERAAVT